MLRTKKQIIESIYECKIATMKKQRKLPKMVIWMPGMPKGSYMVIKLCVTGCKQRTFTYPLTITWVWWRCGRAKLAMELCSALAAVFTFSIACSFATILAIISKSWNWKQSTFTSLSCFAHLTVYFKTNSSTLHESLNLKFRTLQGDTSALPRR